MTHLTNDQRKSIAEASVEIEVGKLTIIRNIKDAWIEAKHGQKAEIAQEAEDATKRNEVPLVEADTIRKWMNAICGVPEDVLTMFSEGLATLRHLTDDRRLWKHGHIKNRGDAVRWAVEDMHGLKSSAMVARFLHPEVRTPEQIAERRDQSRIRPFAEWVETLPPQTGNKARAVECWREGLKWWGK